MSPKPVGNVVFKQLRAARLGLERIGPTLCKLGGQTKVPGTWQKFIWKHQSVLKGANQFVFGHF